MNISRGFLGAGAIYLTIGIVFGIYMGGSGDHSLSPVHAHINLLGFTLMAVFALVYRSFPEMAQNWMARAHFWLHQVGTVILLIALFLLLSNRVAPTTVGPVMPLAEGALLIGTLIFVVNIWRNSR